MRTPAPCSARPSAIPPATSATSRRSPGSRIAHGVPLIVDNTVATPILLQAVRLRRRHRRAFADQVHGRPRHRDGRHHRRFRPLRLDGARRPLPGLQQARRTPITASSMPSASGATAYHRARAQRLSAHHRLGAVADERLPAAAGHRDGGAAHRAPCRERPQGRANSCATIRASTGSTTPASRTAPIIALAQKYLGGKPSSLFTFGVKGGLEAGKSFYDCAGADQAAGQHRRRQVAGLPSGLDHAPADVGGAAAHGRRAAGDDPALDRHRARRRHHRRHRPGAGRRPVPAARLQAAE